MALMLWQNKLECLSKAAIFSPVHYLKLSPTVSSKSGAEEDFFHFLKVNYESLPGTNALAYFVPPDVFLHLC
jgi:hypothetical protein